MIFYKADKFDLRVERDDEYTQSFLELLNSVENNKDSQLCRLPLFEPKKNDNNNLIFAIVEDIGSKPTVVGRVSLENIHYINKSAELKIFVRKDRQKKGIAYEACKLVMRHGFNVLNLNRIYAGTFESNEGFKTLAKKLGMREEGNCVQAVWNDGSYIDVKEYAILKLEYDLKHKEG
ncbi:GNAT family N-acetyltransferase [Candidatus Woesearchaeota archaeon]|nr:GNAT family N-acetyltransferase [Candidatus Woesearchaeota archaeon]